MKSYGKALAPIALVTLLALFPSPDGLSPHAWYYFAIFAGVILGLILEPLPGAAIGWIGISVVTLLSPWTYFSPDEMSRPGFDPAEEAIRWGLSGFSNTTVWLIFSAFMFALGYEKTGLGRRIALVLVRRMGGNTLALGYAVTLADAILAPFTPSNTSRSAGTIYPIIRNLPALYDSRPNDPSARRIGSYLMWTAISATCITSTLFLTGMAPNPLAVELVQKTANVTIGWVEWFTAMAPFGLSMLVLMPLIGFVLYPPEVKRGERLPQWAASELTAMGALSHREILLAVLVVI
ncbi:MAG: DASS family sodium-coupled anion symporter, partial [Vicinamibacteria bacterium]